jgi:hypothetical protein
MALMRSEAQGARALYRGISLIQILVSTICAVVWEMVAIDKARARRLHVENAIALSPDLREEEGEEGEEERKRVW